MLSEKNEKTLSHLHELAKRSTAENTSIIDL